MYAPNNSEISHKAESTEDTRNRMVIDINIQPVVVLIGMAP